MGTAGTLAATRERMQDRCNGRDSQIDDPSRSVR